MEGGNGKVLNAVDGDLGGSCLGYALRLDLTAKTGAKKSVGESDESRENRSKMCFG